MQLKIHGWKFVALAFVATSALLTFVWFNLPRWVERLPWPASLPLSGGKFFEKKVLISLPHYSQWDPLWGLDQLGNTSSTLAEEGCAVSAAAMALSAKGANLNPGQLNALLTQHQNGYTQEGWIYWETAAAVALPGKISCVYEGPADYQRIDTELLRGNPVILRLRLPSNKTHFVVVVGKEAMEYLINDPADGKGSGLRRLSSVGGEITGMRFYLEREPFWNRHFLVKVPNNARAQKN